MLYIFNLSVNVDPEYKTFISVLLGIISITINSTDTCDLCLNIPLACFMLIS